MDKCVYKKYCGGCYKLGSDYHSLLNEKTRQVTALFDKFKGVKVYECLGNYYPYKYRNKIHLSFTELKGKTLVGFFEEGSSKVVDVKSCMLFGDWATKLISIMREFLSRFKIKPYNKFTGAGIIRYVHARCIDNGIQVTLVVATENFAGRDWLLHKLQSTYAEVSLYTNLNRRTDNAIFDNKFKFVGGKKFLEFDFSGLKISISPSSFLQVNLPIAEKMYKQACELLEIDKNTDVIDLYSGIGITSMMFGKQAKRVFAIEETSSSVDNAKYMAKINDCKNIHYFVGKCENLIGSIKDIDENSVVFVDPARAGLDKSVIDTILKFNPRKIVYMSCNPESCLRDIKAIVADNKYILTDIYPWDMFPYTKHIELLCCLQRQV